MFYFPFPFFLKYLKKLIRKTTEINFYISFLI